MKPIMLVSTLFLTLLLTACSVDKRLVKHQNALQSAALELTDPEQQLDVLGTTLVAAIEESLVFINPNKTVQYVERFSDQNKQNIDKILNDVKAHVGNMNLREKAGFYARLATRDYTVDLIELIPKLERKVGRKVKTFTLLSRILDVLNPLK